MKLSEEDFNNLHFYSCQSTLCWFQNLYRYFLYSFTAAGRVANYALTPRQYIYMFVFLDCKGKIDGRSCYLDDRMTTGDVALTAPRLPSVFVVGPGDEPLGCTSIFQTRTDQTGWVVGQSRGGREEVL